MTDEAAVKQAYQRLEEAIARVREADGYARPDEVLMEFVVVTAHQMWDDDGRSLTVTTMLVRDGDMALHRQLGILEYAAARTRKGIVEDGEDDD